tara:strand:- start:242 stop:940 length:699 start_codon:yes stop_codon:yes gene_type:complete
MNYDCRAISLLYHKYGEGSVIAKIFTEEHGLQSFNIKKVRGRKSKSKISLLEKLSLVNISAKKQPKKTIQYINEISLAYPLNNTELNKKLIRVFMAEILSKVLAENNKSSTLFKFIWNLTIELDHSEEIDNNFCLKYLIALTKFLGFFPSTENFEYPIFNLSTLNFTKKDGPSEMVIKGSNLKYFKALITNKNLEIPYLNRQELLKKIFFYYKSNHYNLDNVKSHIVIEALR